jgi:hypothetical protein
MTAGLVGVAGEIWATVQAPGQALNYAQLAWGLLLVAFPSAFSPAPLLT